MGKRVRRKLRPERCTLDPRSGQGTCIHGGRENTPGTHIGGTESQACAHCKVLG
uniref:Uncharacterized protein n=1 Tax=Arundo donax TaxID=35708 RepID=A0A0A8ZBN6_ARUDO